MGAVTHEGHTLCVVPHRIEQTPQRCFCEGEHGQGTDQGVGRNKIVKLPPRREIHPRHRIADDAVAGDAGLSTKHMGKHKHRRESQFGQTQRDHGKWHAAVACAEPAKQCSQRHACEATHHRQQTHRYSQRTRRHLVQHMNGHVGPGTTVDGVSKTQHATLTIEQVVGQAGNHRNANLRQHRQTQAAAEKPGCKQQHHSKGHPRKRQRARRHAHAFWPHSPCGRQTKTSTINKYGNTGANWEALSCKSLFCRT